MDCGFSGRISDYIGSLKQLDSLYLNGNNFTGPVPATIGNLLNLYWLDLGTNQLSGSIPVSNGDTPGLDMLVHTKHFHFGQNQLSGTIPPRLFNSNITLIHVLFDNNHLTGNIPSTLDLVQTLEVVRFDRNSLSGNVPSNINNLTLVQTMTLSNNEFSGPVPDLTGMNSLQVLDLSYNNFEGTGFPQSLSTLQSLTTIMMQQTGIEGEIPEELFSISQLHIVNLKDNRLNGTIRIPSNYSRLMELIDVQNNSIGAATLAPGYTFQLMFYKGILSDGQIVAMKRSQLGSIQGSREFKNEVELLSRVHHKNLVKLVGFCFDKGEQILVYEFIANGTLMDSLSGMSGIQFDWVRRLIITLGSARGLQYLHELADPLIIHRDIKSTNILLDERLIAKVADFGLSKLFGDIDQKGYVTTQVKGTMGYLDPEYFMTNQLTEKSDVFSFGVVMLEMVTARKPIQDGKYIVKVIKEAMDKTKDLYSLHRIIDPILQRNTTMLVGLEKFVDLALKCVQDGGFNRPTMGEVVKGIEHIAQLAGINPNVDSTTTSQSYEGASGGNFGYPYSDDSLFQYSGSILLTRAE